jgi:hypothetical protein
LITWSAPRARTRSSFSSDDDVAITAAPAGVTAWRALVGDGQIRTGDTGVSIAALQIAKMTDAANTCGRLPEGFFAKKRIARPIVRIS